MSTLEICTFTRVCLPTPTSLVADVILMRPTGSPKVNQPPLKTGEVIEVTRPLDFAASHGPRRGLWAGHGVLGASDPPEIEEDCELINKPTLLSFLTLRANVEVRPLIENLSYFGDDKAIERQYHLDTWDAIKAGRPSDHNEPGVFTAFAGYEYSPAMVDRGKHHRNVIFGSGVTPDYAVSAYDADSEIDLWKQLDTTCGEGCEFLTIPHNPQ